MGQSSTLFYPIVAHAEEEDVPDMKTSEMETSEKQMGGISEIISEKKMDEISEKKMDEISEKKMDETSEKKMDETSEKEVQENQKLDETIVDAIPNDVIEEDKKLV